MPDHRHHRGPHPEDAHLFAPEMHDALRSAVADLSWLLSRGYAGTSSLKLVGDRYRLDARQRMAVTRSACTDEQRTSRRVKRIAAPAAGAWLSIDGYNLLTTIEAALGGAVVLRCRDDTVRDIAALHGTWRQVAETFPAAELIGQTLQGLGVGHAHWYFDSPVSNSGRLAALLRQVGIDHGWQWTVDLVPDPDPLLAAQPDLIVTADSFILDECRAWLNLAVLVIEQHVPNARIVDLR